MKKFGKKKTAAPELGTVPEQPNTPRANPSSVEHAGPVFAGASTGPAEQAYKGGDSFDRTKKAQAHAIVTVPDISAISEGWHPRLEIFTKKKDVEPIHLCDLSSATAVEAAQFDKNCTVLTVALGGGESTGYFQLGVPTAERGLWVSAIEKAVSPPDAWAAASAALREEAEAEAAEEAAKKERADIAIAEHDKAEKEKELAASKVRLAELTAKLEGGDESVELAAEIASLRDTLGAKEREVEQADANLRREIEEAEEADEVALRERAEANEARATAKELEMISAHDLEHSVQTELEEAPTDR